jgi:phage shock protein A
VQHGDDELARQALRRKQEHTKLASSLVDQVAAARQTSETLHRQIGAMRAKHAEAKRKLASLSARSRAAHARRQAQLVRTGCVRGSDPFHRFNRLSEQVEMAEAEADALVQLGEIPNDRAPASLDALEDDAAIDAELAALKKTCSRGT